MMSSEIKSVRIVDTVKNIQEAIQSSHHGFPVLNSTGRVVGLIPKNYLIILVQNKHFYG